MYTYDSSGFQTSWDTSSIKTEAVVDKTCKYFCTSRVCIAYESLKTKNLYNESQISKNSSAWQYTTSPFAPSYKSHFRYVWISNELLYKWTYVAYNYLECSDKQYHKFWLLLWEIIGKYIIKVLKKWSKKCFTLVHINAKFLSTIFGNTWEF